VASRYGFANSKIFKKADIKALVDCGASTLFIGERFVKEKQV
jgi:indole-3-glycerol phosphate synthase